jgi:hypothetical protein
MTSGFGMLRPLAHRADASDAHRVPRAGILPEAFSGRFFAVVPLLCGKKFLSSRSSKDFLLPVTSRSAFAFRFASGTSTLRAMPLARNQGPLPIRPQLPHHWTCRSASGGSPSASEPTVFSEETH